MSYDMLLQRALALHDAGQLDEAEAVYRQILETAPEQPDVLNLLGLVAQAKGAQDEACRLFATALRKKGTDDAAICYNLAYSLRLSGKMHEAVDFLQRVLLLKPDLKEAYNELGLALWDLQQPETARENWSKASALDPSYAAARINLARSYEQENPVRAAEELEKVTAVFPGEAAAWYYLSRLCYLNGDYAKAWDAAIKAKEQAPASDDARVMLALLSLQEKQEANAKIYFMKAVMLNPGNIDAVLGLANLNSREGNFEEAEKGYRQAIELDAENFDAHNNYAEMLYRQNRLAEALEEYRKAVIINPKAAEVSNNLALILKDRGEYEEALGLLFNAFILKPNMEETAVNLAETLTLFYRCEPQKAVELAEKWLEYAPDNVFATRVCAALKGQKSENNQIYAQKLFDHFADRYELVMQNLGYTVPLAMGRIAGSLKGSVVDLGCGTGLVGKVLKNSENTLTGVDISAQMLKKAQEKGVYDCLAQDDIAAYLRRNGNFDWAVAADVFGYVGDLSEMVALCRGKNLLFSTENAEDTETYKMSESGRYRHNPAYVRKLLQENGFEKINAEELLLRSENGIAVSGTIWKAESR